MARLALGRVCFNTKCSPAGSVAVRHLSLSQCHRSDFTQAVEEFRRNGVTILPLKVVTAKIFLCDEIIFTAAPGGRCLRQGEQEVVPGRVGGRPGPRQDREGARHQGGPETWLQGDRAARPWQVRTLL